MITKGVRGAIVVERNTENAIKEATINLLNAMIKENKIDTNKISHVIFTLTNDLNAAFPAKFARIDLNWSDVAMMCFHELDVPNSLAMCLRILVVLNCDENFVPKFVYLNGAEVLRK